MVHGDFAIDLASIRCRRGVLLLVFRRKNRFLRRLERSAVLDLVEFQEEMDLVDWVLVGKRRELRWI